MSTRRCRRTRWPPAAPIELLVERDATDRHSQHLAKPLDGSGDRQGDEPGRRATEHVAGGEHEHRQGQGIPFTDPGREREPSEDAVEHADAIGDGDPGHVVLVRLDALADSVVGDDGLDQGLVRGEENEEDRQGGQPVPSSEPHRWFGSRGRARARERLDERCHGVTRLAGGVAVGCEPSRGRSVVACFEPFHRPGRGCGPGGIAGTMGDGHRRRQPGAEPRPSVVALIQIRTGTRWTTRVNSPETTLRGIKANCGPGRLVDPDDPAAEWFREGIERDADRVARLDARQTVLFQVGLDVQQVRVVHAQQGRTRRGIIAQVAISLDHHAGKRGADPGIRQVVLGGL